jgi:hypothetical protein
MKHRLFSILLVGVVLATAVFRVGPVYAGGSQSPALLGVSWYVSTTGNDENFCTTPASPCATIEGTSTKAADGDIIYVAAGTYRESVSIDKSLELLGGWDSTFSTRNGVSIVDAQYETTTALGVGSMDLPITVHIDRFVIQGSLRYGMTASNSLLTITNSTIRDNRGTGFYASINNTIFLENVTITGNFAVDSAGGLYSYNETNTITINHSTIAKNVGSMYGGGVVINGGVITIRNSILANNTATFGADCVGVIDFAQNSIIGDSRGCTIASGTGNQLDTDPLLSAFPIGTLQYHALQPDSPAIDAGDLVTCLATDVRGIARPQGGHCDIGAYEYVPAGPANSFGIIEGTPQKTGPRTTFPVPFAVYVTDVAGNPVAGATVNFVAPGSGASGTFADSGTNQTSAMTDNTGIAIASPFTANAQTGTYSVIATVSGLPGQMIFTLTNEAWYVSPTGSDSNSCSLPSSPCATINGAIEKASDGDTILVASGTYTNADFVDTVVTVHKDVALLGGWNSTFTTQNSYSIVDGQNTKTGVHVGPFILSARLLNSTLDHFIVQNGRGGLSVSYAHLKLKNSVVRNNTALFDGGGINAHDSVLTITDSTIIGNSSLSSSAHGGGIALGVTTSLIIQNSTVADNHASMGGGIANETGAVTLTNVTLSGNEASLTGGALYNSMGYLNLNNVTVTSNRATGNSSGGIASSTPADSFVLENSLIAGNTNDTDPAADCSAALTSKGHNLIGSGEGCIFTPGPGDQIGDPDTPIDPRLGELSDNGGPTFTHALLAGSPAIDAGNDATCASTDQRGVVRPQGSHCDIGAYEYPQSLDTTPPTVISIQRASPSPTDAATVKFTVKFSESVSGVAAGDFQVSVAGKIQGASVSQVAGSGSTYTVTVNTGSGNGTLGLTVPIGASIQDLAGNAIAGLPFTSGQTYSVLKAATFSDVQDTYWAWAFVERLYNAGVTGGCSTNPLQFCPDTAVTRDQMAVFLLKARHGQSYTPPAVGGSTGFGDVAPDHWAAAWIKQLAAEGITGGCGEGNYCPGAAVTRDQMAVFLLKAKYGKSYTPPAMGGSTGFTDVPPEHWAAAWIKQLAAEGITGGCGTGIYCPGNPVNRAEMAVFLVRTFSLP